MLLPLNANRYLLGTFLTFNMQIMRSSFRYNIFFVLLYLIGICFAGCNEDSKPVNNHVTEKVNITDLFLSYTDSVAKLPLNSFNKAGIVSLNKTFADKLPLTIYNGKQESDDKNIIVQAYQNNNTAAISAGMILLVPKSITDSLHVGDFTHRFGNIKKEESISVTEQPLPVEINIDAHTSIKLTFNNNEKLDRAQVTMVEVLKYR
ncbi:hypothetical protein [Pedobacter miscanthi]|uniref:Uncharacterized protein n=1 Tax=Pedobacter miscanthi TaxID=2259170 RepID=A0A366KQN4_9SPHI|nr:hypothetical protein [Pedobacter miscanthi]RBQ03840.1 hypothetical protein DRW42_20340 [Pedobacter miscanthi]